MSDTLSDFQKTLCWMELKHVITQQIVEYKDKDPILKNMLEIIQAVEMKVMLLSKGEEENGIIH